MELVEKIEFNGPTFIWMRPGLILLLNINDIYFYYSLLIKTNAMLARLLLSSRAPLTSARRHAVCYIVYVIWSSLILFTTCYSTIIIYAFHQNSALPETFVPSLSLIIISIIMITLKMILTRHCNTLYSLTSTNVHNWMLGNMYIKRYFLCYWKGPEVY